MQDLLGRAEMISNIRKRKIEEICKTKSNREAYEMEIERRLTTSLGNTQRMSELYEKRHSLYR